MTGSMKSLQAGSIVMKASLIIWQSYDSREVLLSDFGAL